MNLNVNYLGLKLKNPIILGSSGISTKIDTLQRLEDSGLAAVVMKSLFEEQVHKHAEHNYANNDFSHTEAYQYISGHSKEADLEHYLEMVRNAKENLEIPVIASINCHTKDSWIEYTKLIEETGADALEINVSLLPSDADRESKKNEKLYFDILKSVRKYTKLPIALKMSPYSAGLANLIRKLSWTKQVNALVLFNRYYNPDIDINKMSFTNSDTLSRPEDITNTLRWIAIMHGQMEKDLVASTGVHNGEGLIKMLLAGATAVQMVSAIYKRGEKAVKETLNDLQEWMQKNNFNSLDQFRGKLSYKNSNNSAVYERIQFMKHYSGIE